MRPFVIPGEGTQMGAVCTSVLQVKNMEEVRGKVRVFGGARAHIIGVLKADVTGPNVIVTVPQP